MLENQVDKKVASFFHSKTFFYAFLFFILPCLLFFGIATILGVYYFDDVDQYVNSWFEKFSPTHEEIPAYTREPDSTATPTMQSWIWMQMPVHNLEFNLPTNWDANKRIVATDENTPPCTQYSFISPDGNSQLLIYTYCGAIGGESTYAPCEENNVEFIDYENGTARRLNSSDGTYSYVMAHWGYVQNERTLLCSPYWLDLKYINIVQYIELGELDFETLDRMALSLRYIVP